MASIDTLLATAVLPPVSAASLAALLPALPFLAEEQHSHVATCSDPPASCDSEHSAGSLVTPEYHPHLAAATRAPPPSAPRRASPPHQGIPSWAPAIAKMEFFGACPKHANLNKNYCNFYCLCCGPATGKAMCMHCVPDHDATCNGTTHQVYRYMKNDVIRTRDFRQLPLSDIQDYKVNNHPAVHLRPRVVNEKSPAAFTARCRGCDRCMTPEFSYCCLTCKLGEASGVLPPAAVTRTKSLGSEQWRSQSSDEEATNSAPPERVSRKVAAFKQGRVIGAKRRKLTTPERSLFE